MVTTRFQTQYVATEWGIVYLRNKNLAQRAKGPHFHRTPRRPRGFGKGRLQKIRLFIFKA
ncbi:MAG: acetyl-CoA hydrolase/transferase C-terminal domain-containing protein [Candidatus Cryptobacteroides sp.]